MKIILLDEQIGRGNYAAYESILDSIAEAFPENFKWCGSLELIDNELTSKAKQMIADADVIIYHDTSYGGYIPHVSPDCWRIAFSGSIYDCSVDEDYKLIEMPRNMLYEHLEKFVKECVVTDNVDYFLLAE